jgi:hypothetical protein
MKDGSYVPYLVIGCEVTLTYAVTFILKYVKRGKAKREIFVLYS